MSTISVFNHVTIDGFYAGPNGEIDWFKDVPSDSAFEAHTHRQSLVLGAGKNCSTAFTTRR